MLPVALLAGGLATRLRPVTETVPKSLIEVAGRPFVERQLEWLSCEGISKVVLCLGYLGERVQKAVGMGERFGLNIAYSYDGETLLGTGGALRRALPLLGERFFVLYGDSFLTCNFAAVERAFRKSDKAAMMTVYKNEGRWDTSNVVFSEGRIVLYDKKQKSESMQYIDYGLGILDKQTLLRYAENESFDLADLYTDLSKRGELAGFEVQDRFYEIGSFAGLKEAEEFFRGVDRGVRTKTSAGSDRDSRKD
ncbi:MAG: nucleotidyltransferase family protein [Rhodospirillaceae bacterium]